MGVDSGRLSLHRHTRSDPNYHSLPLRPALNADGPRPTWRTGDRDLTPPTGHEPVTLRLPVRGQPVRWEVCRTVEEHLSLGYSFLLDSTAAPQGLGLGRPRHLKTRPISARDLPRLRIHPAASTHADVITLDVNVQEWLGKAAQAHAQNQAHGLARWPPVRCPRSVPRQLLTCRISPLAIAGTKLNRL